MPNYKISGYVNEAVIIRVYKQASNEYLAYKPLSGITNYEVVFSMDSLESVLVLAESMTGRGGVVGYNYVIPVETTDPINSNTPIYISSVSNSISDLSNKLLTVSGIAQSAYSTISAPIDADRISQDANHRFLSDEDITTLSGKADVNHQHNDLYYTKSQLGASDGEGSLIHWNNIIGAPSYGSEAWLTPVANQEDLTSITGMSSGDCVLVQDDGDGKAAQYSYNGSIWVKIGDVDWAPFTDAQVKAAYERNSDTNTLTDAKDANLTTAYNHSQAAHAPSNANYYVHPTTAGNKHIPTSGAVGQVLEYDSTGTAKWGRKITVSTSDPSGGVNGDIWFKVS